MNSNTNKTNGFIKNDDLLEETDNIPDLLHFNKIVDYLDERLSKIEKNVVIGFTGSFGTGKSTALHQLKERYKNNQDIKWIKFDAWKYPNKTNLWENFVLDFIKQTSHFDHMILKIFNRFTIAISILAFLGLNINISALYMIYNWSSYSSIIVLLSLIIILVSFFYALYFITSKNINDLHSFLKFYIKCRLLFAAYKTIYIVIEDVDRAFQDGGIFFLETLSYFLKKYKLNRQIIAIVPINTDYLNKVYITNSNNNSNTSKTSEPKEPYLKSISQSIPFKPNDIDFSTFIKEIFELKQIGKDENLVINHLQYILSMAASEHMSIRLIKKLIREANNIYESSLTSKDKQLVDIRIWLAFYFAEHMEYNKLIHSNCLDNNNSITNVVALQIKNIIIAISKGKKVEEVLKRLQSELQSVKSDCKKVEVCLDSSWKKKEPNFTPLVEDLVCKNTKDVELLGQYVVNDIYVKKLSIN